MTNTSKNIYKPCFNLPPKERPPSQTRVSRNQKTQQQTVEKKPNYKPDLKKKLTSGSQLSQREIKKPPLSQSHAESTTSISESVSRQNSTIAETKQSVSKDEEKSIALEESKTDMTEMQCEIESTYDEEPAENVVESNA